jgi:hypothetical protein
MDDEKSKYNTMLEKYLSEGIDYTANTIFKAEQGDLEQLAADSYWQGWQDANTEHSASNIQAVSGSLHFTEREIDLAYLAGVLNVSGIDGLQKEIERLKGLGKKPHDIIIEGRQQ